jgi:hypothetical protein
MIRELVQIGQIVVVATATAMIVETATVMIANQEISFAVAEL